MFLNYFRSLIGNRRITRDEACEECEYNRRKMSFKEATQKMENAAHELTRTVTLSPERVKELIRKAGL